MSLLEDEQNAPNAGGEKDGNLNEQENDQAMSLLSSSSSSPSPSSSSSSSNGSPGWMIFGPASFLQALNGVTYGLPTTYVGIRRVRPSSKSVHHALQQQQQQQQKPTTTAAIPAAATTATPSSSSIPPPIVYKLVDPVTGVERRMTAQEKRTAKCAHKRIQRKFLQEQKDRQQQQQQQLDHRNNSSTKTAAWTQDERNDDKNVQNSQDGGGCEPRHMALETNTTDLSPKRGDGGGGGGSKDGDDDDNDFEEEEEMEDVVAAAAAAAHFSPSTSDGDTKAQPAVPQSSQAALPDNEQPEYVQFKVNPSALEQELADLQGEREGVPPVWLSSAQVASRFRTVLVHPEIQQPQPPQQQSQQIQANKNAVTATTISTNRHNKFHGTLSLQEQDEGVDAVELDEGYSQFWAKALHSSSLQAAETTRQQETQWRALPYALVPQVWTRLRPPLRSCSSGNSKTNHQNNDSQQPSKALIEEPHEASASSTDSHDEKNNVETNNTERSSTNSVLVARRRDEDKDFNKAMMMMMEQSKTTTTEIIMLPMELRQRRTDYHRRLDLAMQACVHYVNQELGLYVACGAKFGCDFLLYDGPRSRRHAFAGLRVVVVNNNNKDKSSWDYPLPRAYDLTGYVRCLNTAGKLALLATLVVDQNDNDDDDANDNNMEVNKDDNDKSNKHGKHKTRVAFLDLALVRIRHDDDDSNGKKQKRKRKRKTLEERFLNLTKQSKTNDSDEGGK
ncbi:hypothetical protein ACA910_018761 [Epithemia clementina (nom. ined.)]